MLLIGGNDVERKPGRKAIQKDKKRKMMPVVMSQDDIDLLTAEAERRGVSRSELVRGMLEARMKGIREGA